MTKNNLQQRTFNSNDIEVIKVKTSNTSLGAFYKEGTLVYVEDEEQMYILLVNTIATLSINTTRAKLVGSGGTPSGRFLGDAISSTTPIATPENGDWYQAKDPLPNSYPNFTPPAGGLTDVKPGNYIVYGTNGWAEVEAYQYLLSVDASNISCVKFYTSSGRVITESFGHSHPEYKSTIYMWDGLQDMIMNDGIKIVSNNATPETVLSIHRVAPTDPYVPNALMVDIGEADTGINFNGAIFKPIILKNDSALKGLNSTYTHAYNLIHPSNTGSGEEAVVGDEDIRTVIRATGTVHLPVVRVGAFGSSVDKKIMLEGDVVGATGTFKDNDGNIITVTNGIITSLT